MHFLLWEIQRTITHHLHDIKDILGFMFRLIRAQKQLDRRGLPLSWRSIDGNVRSDAARYLQDDKLEVRSIEQYVVFIGFTLRQIGHMFVELRERSIILRIDDRSVRNRQRHSIPPYDK